MRALPVVSVTYTESAATQIFIERSRKNCQQCTKLQRFRGNPIYMHQIARFASQKAVEFFVSHLGICAVYRVHGAYAINE